MILYLVLLSINCLTEYFLIKMMVMMDVLKEKYRVYHAVCAILRILWIFSGAWFAIPMPILLIVLFILLFLNVVPYPKRKLMMNNFTMIIYLIYTTLLMTVISIAGLFGIDVSYMVQDTTIRGMVMSTTFVIFNIICFLLLYYRPEFLWKEDYDKSKVLIYTHFLFICAIYQILDAVILTLYMTTRVNYVLLVSGDILILILMFNFLNYNYVFAKSEEIKREYEENEIQIAQEYFHKESLKKLSGLDSLTNAYNRREICSIMTNSIANGHQLICVFIDLDGLKRTNDKYGHTYGDFMLKHFADTCMELMPEKGYLARIGGDEFLLVFLDEPVSDIEELVKNLQLKLLEPADGKDQIYFSYGISSGEESVDRYINIADQRMYEDKNRKRRETI